MDENEFASPFHPETIAVGEGGCVRKYCVSPTNGRLEWLQAEVEQKHLNSGTDVSDEMSSFLLAGDKNPMDTPALIIHKSLGGKGDDVYNVFLEGRSFDRETYNNDIESTVYYALKEAKTPAIITIKFIFKNQQVTRPYKIAYQVQLPNGDVVENDLPNV